MRVRHSVVLLVTILCGIFLLPSALLAGGPRLRGPAASVIRVDRNSPGPAHDGTTWDTAYLTVQAGITGAASGDQVWVADGTYTEDLTMKLGVAVYGGFLGAQVGGYETTLAARDFVNHVATVQGTHTKSVVTMPATADSATRIDGFTITNGSAASGGGAVCTNSSPTIANCIFSGNTATSGSGVYANDTSGPWLTDNTFTNNVTGYPVSVLCNMIQGRLTGNSGSGNATGNVIEVRGGNVKASQTWTANPMVYRVTTANVAVYLTGGLAVLTLPAGTTVEFASGFGLTIGTTSTGWIGALVCAGEAGSEVVLRAASGASGGWPGVTFQSKIDTAQTVMTYCRIENGGQTTNANVTCAAAGPTFTNCVISGSSGRGIYGDDSALPLIEDCTFTSNVGYPISVYCNAAGGLTGNTGSGNGAGNVIEVRGGRVDTSQTWAPNPMIYHVTTAPVTVFLLGGLSVLTLPAGTTVEFASACGLSIGHANTGWRGALVCAGEAGSEVVLRAASGAAGGWPGVTFLAQTEDALTILAHCRIENGGQTTNANVTCTSANPTFTNCTVSGSSARGIYSDDNSLPLIEDCTFISNVGYPISVYCNAVSQLTGNSGSGNTAGNVIEVRGGQVDTSQTWEPNPMVYRVTTATVTVYQLGGLSVLTLPAGTTVEFANACGLSIGNANSGWRGGLVCAGEAGSEVVLRAASGVPGGWPGVTFLAQTEDAQTLLTYCRIENGGQTTNADVTCTSAGPTFANCAVSGSIGRGIYSDDGSLPLIENCPFTSNVGNPISVFCNAASGVKGNSGSGNTAGNVIEVRGGLVETTQTWEPNPMAYRATSNVTVYLLGGLSVLTLASGTTVEFASGCGLTIGSTTTGWRGALVCAGVVGSEVVLTAVSGAPGGWPGVTFQSQTDTGQTALKHCRIENGGQNTNANVYCLASSPALTNCTIARSSVYGVRLSTSNAFISGCSITDNTSSGMYITGGTPRVTNCAIVGNHGAIGGGVYCTNASPVIANNVIAYNASGIFKTGTGTATLRCNCMYSNTAYNYSGIVAGAGDIALDPLLADWANGDFHINPLSPCLDAGSNVDLDASRLYVDVDTEPRLADGDGDLVATVDIGVDEIYTTSTMSTTCPTGLFLPGWVWFSMPIIPQGSSEVSAVLGYNAINRVFGYDGLNKTFLLYADDFTDLAVGPSYLAVLTISESYAPSYVGTSPTKPFSHTLPAAGFSWVGVPGQQVIYGMDLCVSKGGVTRTVAQDKAAASPWLNWNWIYWDSAGQTARIMDPTGGGDDLWIHPWWGYRVWANTENVTIIFP